MSITPPPSAVLSDDALSTRRAVLFLDQTSKLGGAELCLFDIVVGRGNPSDQVFLFEEGPLADRFRAAGVGISVCQLGDRGASVRKGSGWMRKAASLGGVVRLARRVARQSRGVDIIYANTAKALVIGAIAGKMARRPVVYHLHDILSADHFSWSNRKILQTAAKLGVALVIANSQASADSLIAAGFDPQRVVVIPNGIDPAPFDAAIADSDRLRRALRQSLGLGEDEPLLGLFGRLSPWKGQHIAIESLESLPGVHLLLVGDALFGEEAYVERLRRLAARPGVEGRVHFVGFRDDVAGVMQGVEVVIHASTSPEPFGRVIVEAMLASRPVVATRGGGASEIIDEGKNGLLCEPCSVKSLAEKVRLILAGGPQVEALVVRGGVSARERFAPGLILQQIETALMRLPKKV